MQRHYALKLLIIMQVYTSIAENTCYKCVFYHINFYLSYFLMSIKLHLQTIKKTEFYRNNAYSSYLYRNFYIYIINILYFHKNEKSRSSRNIDIIYGKYKKAVTTNTSLLQPLYIVEIN